ncbi:class I SAM-dependent methyltransferase [Nocardioides nematodiphilus]|uniref:class I SAM-dependent methyltransferase n=1 Tax=Nocardioides nematodiphilus TaxID=2849669 RepID=UPI001CDA2FD3|nr:class I SAM-dependent methyltransferase [Nocardioides nematodiphilus]MCA1983400.1 class I SAM-dependent methyltransferase [Nocardioides nematodiphilus]
MVKWRGRDVSDTWRLDHPWASVYSFGMAHRPIARTAGVVGFGTDFDRMYDAIASIGDLPAGSTVLDVPCGGGVALRGLVGARRIRYVAADISIAMLARTRRTAAGLGVEVEPVEADVADLPMEDRSVDLTLSLTGLHCFPDPRAAIREIARVTRDRIELSWLRSDAGLRYRPILIAGRAGGLVGRSATADEVGLWLAECGFDAEIRIEGAFAYASARRG